MQLIFEHKKMSTETKPIILFIKKAAPEKTETTSSTYYITTYYITYIPPNS